MIQSLRAFLVALLVGGAVLAGAAVTAGPDRAVQTNVGGPPHCTPCPNK